MYINYQCSGEVRLGFLDGDRVRRLAGGPTDDLVTAGFPEVPPDAPVERGDIRYLPALLRPGKIVCLMRSYLAHAEERGHEPPLEPMFFAKLRNALNGHREPIRIPYDLDGEVHHEGELAVVIGRGGRRLTPESAVGCVAAYTIANDVTARTLQKSDAGRGWPWVRAKSRDTFLPLGPGLVPADRIPDPHALDLTVRVNGEIRQQGSTARLLWTLPEILAGITKYVALEPGDLVLTGTPEGVGPILPGDLVSVEIAQIGVLESPVALEEGA